MDVTILTEAVLRACVTLDAATIDAIEAGFTSLTRGDVTMPPILRLDIAEKNGEVDVKTAYIRGLEAFAIKVSSGFFDNPSLGLPSTSGMMLLLSAETGFVKAVLLDNGYLTDIRTAAAGAVAARHLAREDVRTVGVIGAGAQARYQILALKQVREFEKVMVYGRRPERVRQYIAEMRPALGVEIIAAADAEAVVHNSEIVVTATPAKTPYFKAGWLHPGLHITAMGSDAEHKQELFADVAARADLLACDRRSQSARLGEFHHAVDAGLLSIDNDVVELGEITSGQRRGRATAEQVTIADLTGTGVQDTVIALRAYHLAREKGLGSVITA